MKILIVVAFMVLLAGCNGKFMSQDSAGDWNLANLEDGTWSNCTYTPVRGSSYKLSPFRHVGCLGACKVQEPSNFTYDWDGTEVSCVPIAKR